MKENYITREQTLQMKGIAIMLMLWLHLYMDSNKCVDLSSLIAINGLPLCHFLTRFGGACVTMYVFMSGYGLWIVHRRGQGLHNGRRITSLYALVALVGILFFPLHSVVNPDLGWTFGLKDILNNMSGFNPYNGEWWFLFPYVVTMLLAPQIFPLMERWPRRTTALAIAISLASTATFIFLLHYVWGQKFYTTYRAVEMLLVVGEFMMPFTMGAFCAKTGFLKVLNTCALKYKLLLFGLLAAMLITQMYININSFNVFIGLIFCFVGITFNSSFLTKMGGGKHRNVALPHIPL